MAEYAFNGVDVSKSPDYLEALRDGIGALVVTTIDALKKQDDPVLSFRGSNTFLSAFFNDLKSNYKVLHNFAYPFEKYET